ncbi:MAG: GGDEF domain-containing protein [Acidobacteriia bacterium]|nr:GGDEF domain-containing protein [Terriglobia bacterium]
MGGWGKFAGFSREKSPRFLAIAVAALLAVFFGGVLWLRSAGVSGAPQTYLYLEICGTLLSFCYAANALVRFRGTHDRTALILAFGFVISGILETLGYFGLADLLQAGPLSLSRVPMSWMVSRTLLAILLLSALGVERRMPTSRQPSREIAGALLVVVVAGYLTSAAFLAAPAAPLARAAHLLSRPWDLLPGLLFLAAACFYYRRLRETQTLYDYALFGVTLLNAASHAAACFSRQLFDGPFFLAEVCKTASYAVMLGGALLDQARLFEQVSAMAVSDPLTGLANYRRLVTVLNGELDRSRRSGRPFSVVLLDMDDLKAINDRFGHLTGSRAICRLGNVLRLHSRTIDTAARYGGDEFVLVLPEAKGDVAARVVERVRERLAQDGELPRLSVSAGAAVFPDDGETAETLLTAADHALYRMKHRRTNLQSISRIAACL